MREQRKVVTILFCDLVGSTALGESTDPEALRARMQSYFEDLRAIVERHGGAVEKFVGDAVMAVFGIPTAYEDDALRAVRAASEMRGVIAAHGLEARIGVNTGEVVVGGDGETLITGDAVNVAARLEQAAAAGETLIGSATRVLVRDATRVEPVERLVLKGKTEPVEAFRLIDVVGDEPVARRFDTPLVGRERERQRLWRDYEDAVADGACRLFTLLGPAGIGKSRLVADFLERVADADVLRGRCLHYGEGITYWPLVEMLAPLGVEPESVVASTPEETRVAFRRLLEARAAERPLVVVVDDLQWAEPVFVDLVEHVADLSRGAPIFLLCIARTELLETRPDWGGGKLNATSLLLEPLAEAERATLIGTLLGERPLDASVRDRIAEASAGYPLYVEEMLAMLREQDDGDVSVPPTIQALLQARIDSLESDVRVVLERAAIEGEVFHRSAVAELLPEGLRPDLESQLASLLRKDLIRSADSLIAGEDAYRFRHVLIRDAAYSAMPKELRATLHERFADWLERSAGAPAFERNEILGYHLEQAYRWRTELGKAGEAEQELASRAAERLLAAGRAAFGRADYPAAGVLLERAVGLLAVHDPHRVEALPDLARVLSRTGQLERASEVLRMAIEDAREIGDTRTDARARLVLGNLLRRTDPAATVEDGLAEALALAAELERVDDRETLAQAYHEIGLFRFMLGHAAEGTAELKRSAELARQAGDVLAEMHATTAMLRPMAYGPTPAAEGLAFCNRLLESDRVNVGHEVHALHVRALFAAMNGDVDLSRSSGTRALALVEEFGFVVQLGICACDVSLSCRISGDLEAANRELSRAIPVLTEMGETGTRATLTALHADVLSGLGRLEEAEGRVEESRTIAGPDDLDAQPRWRTAMARVLVRRGELAPAEQLTREALALLEPLDFLALKADANDVLGEIFARAGRGEEAVVAVDHAVALHEQKGNVVSAARSRAVLDELRAARPS